jgi:hypothetical protein
MTDALGQHLSPGVLLEQGPHLSTQHLHSAEVGSGHQPGTPVSRYYASFIAWRDQDTQPRESAAPENPYAERARVQRLLRAALP